MKWTSALAIYSLFWVMSAFVLLPFGVRTHDEAGIEKIPGQADSAPANFRPRRLALFASILAGVLTALFVVLVYPLPCATQCFIGRGSHAAQGHKHMHQAIL